jgi:transcriptional regulator with XRE-family HTH domain
MTLGAFFELKFKPMNDLFNRDENLIKDPEQIPDIMRTARCLKGLTQKKLSEMSGVAPSTIGDWERYTHSIWTPSMFRIFQALGYEFVLRKKRPKTTLRDE